MKTIIESYRAGLFNKKFWIPNILSGLIVGIVALPLAMAFAIASGAKPEQGLYTAMIAGFLVSVLGGSRVQIAGPTGAFIVVLAGITAQYGMDGLQIATLMAGCLLLLMGLLRLGRVIQFIPYPVILGFTAGIAVVIWVGQWASFFGLPAAGGTHFHEKIFHLVQSLPQLNVHTTLLASMSLLIIVLSQKISFLKRIPGPIFALIVATGVQAFFHMSDVATIGSAFGGIPSGWPPLTWPACTFERLVELTGPALTIAMLGAIESLLSAVVADGMTGTRHDSNRELIGQGIANICVPFFNGFAATGAIARTATNIRNGGNSPLAGIVHSLTILLVILFLAPLASSVPLAALAAILFVVAWNMSELPHAIKLIRRAPRADVLILCVTFFTTVFVDLVVAVNLGVLLAMVHFLWKMTLSVDLHTESLPDNVWVYTIKGPLFFGVADKLQLAMAEHAGLHQTVILQLQWVPFIDITGLHALEKIIHIVQKHKMRIMICGANAHLHAKLQKAGIMHVIGQENVHTVLDDALATCA